MTYNVNCVFINIFFPLQDYSWTIEASLYLPDIVPGYLEGNRYVEDENITDDGYNSTGILDDLMLTDPGYYHIFVEMRSEPPFYVLTDISESLLVVSSEFEDIHIETEVSILAIIFNDYE